MNPINPRPNAKKQVKLLYNHLDIFESLTYGYFPFESYRDEEDDYHPSEPLYLKDEVVTRNRIDPNLNNYDNMFLYLKRSIVDGGDRSRDPFWELPYFDRDLHEAMVCAMFHNPPMLPHLKHVLLADRIHTSPQILRLETHAKGNQNFFTTIYPTTKPTPIIAGISNAIEDRPGQPFKQYHHDTEEVTRSSNVPVQIPVDKMMPNPHNETDNCTIRKYFKKLYSASRAMYNDLVEICLQKMKSTDIDFDIVEMKNYLQRRTTHQSIESRNKWWLFQLNTKQRQDIALTVFNALIKVQRTNKKNKNTNAKLQFKKKNQYAKNNNSRWKRATTNSIKTLFAIEDKGKNGWNIKVRLGSRYKGNELKKFPSFRTKDVVVKGRGKIPSHLQGRRDNMKNKSYPTKDADGIPYRPDERLCRVYIDHNHRVTISFPIFIVPPTMFSKSLAAPKVHKKIRRRSAHERSVSQVWMDPGAHTFASGVTNAGDIFAATPDRKLIEEEYLLQKKLMKKRNIAMLKVDGQTPVHARSKGRQRQRKRNRRGSNPNRKREKTRKNNAKRRRWWAKQKKIRNLHKRLLRSLKRERNRVSDFHRKFANFLCTFDVVCWPKFPWKKLLQINRVDYGKNLSKKNRHVLKTLSHGKFRRVLRDMAQARGVKLVHVNEGWTSKTCAECGHVNHDLGAKKTFSCAHPGCKWRCPRDINAALNIRVRSMQKMVKPL